jgi:large subunit ribosomal protein L17
MFKNLAANLILHERIETTDAKAKELRRVAERLITRAKRLGAVAYTAQADLSDKDKARRLHAQRVVGSLVPRFGAKVDKAGVTTKVDLVEKVFVDLAKRFSERPGGYTRIIKVGPRRGDGAPISLIEWVDATGPVVAVEGSDDAEKPAAKAGKAKSKKATAVASTGGAKAE